MSLTTEFGYEVQEIYTDSNERVCIRFINPDEPDYPITLTKADMQGLLDNWIGTPEDHKNDPT